MITKKRKIANAKVDANKAYTLKEASALVKEINTTKFDSSVDLHVRLGVDPKKADQAIRGTVSLPHGTGKTKKVLVLCTPDKEAEAKAAADRAAQDRQDAARRQNNRYETGPVAPNIFTSGTGGSSSGRGSRGGRRRR